MNPAIVSIANLVRRATAVVLGDGSTLSGKDGIALVSGGALATKITESGADTYIAEAAPGTAEATAAWRAMKIDTTGTITWADGNGSFDNVATDLTALTYS